MYEDDDGPSEMPVEIPKSSVVLSVSGYDADRVVTMVAEKLADAAAEHVRERISKEIEKAVSAATEELCRERIGKEIERVLEDGWVQTDEYGSPRGSKKTIKDRISDLLNRSDRYSNPTRWLDELIANTVREVFKGPFAKEVSDAQLSFRKQVDDLLSGKIADGLKSALGLKS